MVIPALRRPLHRPHLAGLDDRVADALKRLREIERRKAISYLRVQKGNDLVVWRRAS